MGPYELSFQERLEEDDARFARSNPGSPGSPSEKAVPWAAIIPAVADIFSYFGNRADTDRRLNQQRQWQVEDWNRQNEYNSPAAVMARLRSAGINPDIVAGGASSNAAMPAQGSVPSSSQSMSLGSISRIAELREQARLQNDLVRSEINLNNANAEGARAGIEHGSRSLELEEIKTQIQRNLADSNIKLNDAQIGNLADLSKKITSEIAKLDSETAINLLQSKWIDQESQQRINLIKAQIRQSNSSADLSDKQISMLEQQITELVETWAARKENITASSLADAAMNHYGAQAFHNMNSTSYFDRVQGRIDLIGHVLLNLLGIKVKL